MHLYRPSGIELNFHGPDTLTTTRFISHAGQSCTTLACTYSNWPVQAAAAATTCRACRACPLARFCIGRPINVGYRYVLSEPGYGHSSTVPLLLGGSVVFCFAVVELRSICGAHALAPKMISRSCGHVAKPHFHMFCARFFLCASEEADGNAADVRGSLQTRRPGRRARPSDGVDAARHTADDSDAARADGFGKRGRCLRVHQQPPSR